MQFIDKAKIHLESGAGGNGMVAWRREKFVSHGGPAGGDGGRGGSVYLEATESLNTLLDFKYKSIFKAGDGTRGGSKNQHGRSGEDIIIKVPCGTVVRDTETGDAIADLTVPEERILVAAGGRGGRGNARFTSSVRQSPQFSEPGEPGIIRELELELKLIADVGIIGLPNAGKSTLISVISAAKPKIADYPFTTLTPNLGVVRKPDGNGVVIADIPGLIEGASDGAGLGHEFLRHVERTRLLIHLIDVSTGENPVQNYDLINEELKKYAAHLSKKPQVVALSKIDAVTDEDLETALSAVKKASGDRVFAISSLSRKGLDDLLKTVFDMLDTLPVEENLVEVVADYKAFDHDDSAYEIKRTGKTFTVNGGKVERLVGITDMRNRAAVYRLMNILKSMGVFAELAKAGAQLGHTVVIGSQEFDYTPDDEA